MRTSVPRRDRGHDDKEPSIYATRDARSSPYAPRGPFYSPARLSKTMPVKIAGFMKPPPWVPSYFWVGFAEIT